MSTLDDLRYPIGRFTSVAEITEGQRRVWIAQIADLPARGYTVRVWHPQQEGSEDATRQPLEVVPGRRAELGFVVTLKPEVRVRRAPIGAHAGHY